MLASPKNIKAQLAHALLWPPPVPADSFLGGSSVPFGRLKRLRSGSTQLANALLWPPPVPEDSFLGGSSVPFGGLNRLRSGSTLLSLRVLPFLILKIII